MAVQTAPFSAPLFQPLRMGDIDLTNRIVMAPLTRARARPRQVPTESMAEYYAQRANAGLIIAEATQISPEGQGYLDTPGIHSQEQIDAWRKVTDGVHRRGGKIVLQLWHVGRISHVSLLPGGQAPLAPSAIRANTKTFTAQGFEPVSEPRALEEAQIYEIIAQYRQAALNAIDAGFDGIEVHGANGYLIDQFLRDGSNQRNDRWGGSIDNRTRLLREVASAVAEAIDAGRVGVRLSPMTPFNDISDSNPQALFEAAVEQLAPLGLAYLHVVEGALFDSRHLDTTSFDYAALRRRFPGAWMVNNGYDRSLAIATITEGKAELVAFGRPFIGNPDLVARLRLDAPLNEFKQELFYGGDAEGYTDYPTLAETG